MRRTKKTPCDAKNQENPLRCEEPRKPPAMQGAKKLDCDPIRVKDTSHPDETVHGTSHGTSGGSKMN
jgi:hypothetical protein